MSDFPKGHAGVLEAPFPWFGGKRVVAPWVWSAMGDVDNYVEPFAGSLAVLLHRPPRHRRRAETVNDADHFLANFWRAIQRDGSRPIVSASPRSNRCLR